MKVDWKRFHTNDSLRDKLKTKLDLRERLVDKIAKYDLQIHELETELLKRGASTK